MNDGTSVARTAPRGKQNPRGGRRRGAPELNGEYYLGGSQRGHDFRGGRGEPGRQRRGRDDRSHSTFMPDAQLTIRSGRPLDHAPKGCRTDDPSDAEQGDVGRVGQGTSTDHNKPVDEKEVCFICASTIEHWSIAPCNHQTCHICALRLRALYKKLDCAYCKVSNGLFNPPKGG